MSYGYRQSGDDLAYGDAYDDNRWDRGRFERARFRGGRESEAFRFEESDRFGPRGGERRDIEVEDRYQRVGSRGGRVEERDRFFEEDRYAPGPQARREAFFGGGVEVEGREMAPYRGGREFDVAVRRGARPQYARRQSSLDTYDRRPVPRYAEREEDVKVQVRVNSPPQRYREDYRYEDEEDYRDVRIRRERERSIVRGPPARRGYEVRESFEEDVVSPPRRRKTGKTRMPKRLVAKRALLELGYPFEEEDDFFFVQLPLQKPEIDEVLALSEQFKEGTTIVTKVKETKMIEAPAPSSSSSSSTASPPPAVQETEIVETVTTKVIENPTDEDIEKYGSGGGGDSASSVHESEHVSVRASERGGGGSASVHASENAAVSEHGRGGSVAGSEHISGHLAASVRSPSPSRSGRRGRSHSRYTRHSSTSQSVGHVGVEREEVDISLSTSGPLALVVPDRRTSTRERDLKIELRALDKERKALKYEREAEEKRLEADREIRKLYRKSDRERDREVDVVEERDVVRVEKDKRGRLNLVRSAH